MEADDKKQDVRIQVRADQYQAGKKNKGGAAYNILNLNYDNNKDGQTL